jgi:pyruvate,water dikinase
MVTLAIEAAHRAGKKIGICGQAPSDYPEFARFLVEKGISSISLNPDTVLQTTHTILEAEAGITPKDTPLKKTVPPIASSLECLDLSTSFSETLVD